MTDTQKTAPQQMTDTDMDAISGGPHFKTWSGDIYSVAPQSDTAEAGHYTQMAWGTTR